MSVLFPNVPNVPGVPPILRNLNPAVFSGTISGTVMGVSTLNGVLAQGQTVTGNGVAAGTQIVSQISGSAGAAGSYIVSIEQEVPALTLMNSIYTPFPPALLFSDTINTFGAPPTIQWGVFLNGANVIEAESTLRMEFKSDYAISDYPIEQGAFRTYNKVQVPAEARLVMASGESDAAREALLDSVNAIIGTLNPYDIVTPEGTYAGYNPTHYDFLRTAENGVGLLKVAIYFEQIRIAPNATFTQSTSAAGTAIQGNQDQEDADIVNNAPLANVRNITNPKTPGGASVTNSGTVQSVPATAAQANDAVNQAFQDVATF